MNSVLALKDGIILLDWQGHGYAINCLGCRSDRTSVSMYTAECVGPIYRFGFRAVFWVSSSKKQRLQTSQSGHVL